MKLNKITLALIAAAAAPMMATAGVTVSPILLGYHYTEAQDDDNQEKLGFYQEDDLYTGAALGIELTPSTQFQVEYGVTDSDAIGRDGKKFGDAEREMITGNFLVGFDEFSGYRDTAFRPYALIGAGQQKIKVNRPDGSERAETKDTIGNLGLGAMYRINDALSLRGEARAIHNFDHNLWDGMALAGLEVVLGGHLAPAVAAPLATVEPTPVILVEADQDSDGDGVIDRLDQCPNTPANVVVDETGCPVQIQIDDELKMELRVFFDNDKSIIKEQYKPEIAKVAEKMREYPNSSASIEGHASKTGPSARYNQRLSEARAIAVKTMLTNEFGVAPNRLSTVGYGYDRPIAPNDTEEGRAMNRRVYAVITGNKTMTVDQTKDMNVQ
ncbi:OmpA family protein [Psychrobacter piechaudii]|uniref:Outer membrane protein Omp38 n=1 Tax=Psychrobacter piechaudii TaxID=1945521 RepID=A0A1R4GGQ1_9GAMM|nr:OmpA family protein [Psychrobacter piechaudii]SJM67280.1 Outer membrane protein Omp38 precursor [Psychrobacter piechaudii]